MSYPIFFKGIVNILHWNLDQLFNYFDLDSLSLDKEITNSPNVLIQIIIFCKHFFISSIGEFVYYYFPLFESLKHFFIEIINGDWITNFSNLSLMSNKFIECILNEDLFFRNQYVESLTILQLPVYIDNKFFIGFLNGLFLSLPFSCNQLICFYRFIAGGPRYGLISTLGWISGQLLLLLFIFFGVKPIIIPWFSLEPLNYFIAVFLIVTFFHDTLSNKSIENEKQLLFRKKKALKKKKKINIKKLKKERKMLDKMYASFGILRITEIEDEEDEEMESLKFIMMNKNKNFYKFHKINKFKNKVINIFTMHFILSWTENGYIFSYLKNINMGVEPNIFDISYVNNFTQYFIIHGYYILGIFLGCLFFSYIYNKIFLSILLYLFMYNRNSIMKTYKQDEFIKKYKKYKKCKEKSTSKNIILKLLKKKIKKRINKHKGKFKLKFLSKSKLRKLKSKYDRLENKKNFVQIQKGLYKKKRIIRRKYIRFYIGPIISSLLILILSLTISSISYYDIRYLITNPLGFIPQDKTLSNLLLTSASDDPSARISLSFRSDKFDDFMDIDIINFDNKEYRNILEFEDLNYEAEYAWMSKAERSINDTRPLRVIKRPHLKRDKTLDKDIPENIVNFTKKILNKKIPRDVFTIKKTKSLVNKKNKGIFFLFSEILKFLKIKNIDSQIDQNYIFNDFKFTTLNETIDDNFKVDFIPYNKYFFAADIIDIYTIELEEEIKQKYYMNFVYKMLLNFEIDAFLSRQLNHSILSEFEELDLFQKRNTLSNYYESNYYYSKINHFDKFRELFFNSKSFINNIYNQQFKGTFRIVEKLFYITLNKNNRSILKYDNSLFYKKEMDIFHHEELLKYNIDNNINNYKGLDITNSSPLFIGWNTDLHQLVITNNLILKNLPLNNDISNLDISRFKTNQFIYGSMNINNFQTLNSLTKNSYSLIQTPSLKTLFSTINSNRFHKLPFYNDNIYNLNLMDLRDSNFLYFMKLSVLIKPQQNSLNQTNMFNWYSFRYKRSYLNQSYIFKLDNSKGDRLNSDKLGESKD